MNPIKKVYTYFYNLCKYVVRGGVVYYNVSNLEASNRFVGKTVLITGGSSGFGFQMATDFVKEGAEVIITGRNNDKLTKAANKISSDRIKTLVWDIGDVEHTDEYLAKALSMFGKIDIFINNAGLYSLQDGLDTTFDDWNKVIKTNLTAAFFLMKSEAIYLKKEYRTLGGGKIINITSVGAFKKRFNSYHVAKNGISFLSEGIAKELAPYNICVNCVAPGEALTSPEMSVWYNKVKDGNNYFASQPNHRFTRVEDISSTVMFLASDEANNITGVHVPVDGGWSVNQ